MDIFTKLSESFWSPNFWLPGNLTWEDITSGSHSEVQYAEYKDLIWPLPLAVILILIRFSLEGFLLQPIGKSLSIQDTRPKPVENIPALTKAYEKSKRLERHQLKSLTKQLDMTARQIERWWRLRKAQDKPTLLAKFCETTWRVLYSSTLFLMGLGLLWDKPWFWEFKNCWYGYPQHSYSTGIWCYYMATLSFYWSLIVTQFYDVKRKDFWQMFTHHVVALILGSLSWICNLHRVGSLVIVIHDCTDIFLEAAKMAKYMKYQKLCDLLFGIFTLIWIIARLGFYPRLIYSSTFEFAEILSIFPAYYIFNGLLIALLILNIMWTYMIIIVLIDSLQKGLIAADCRSSDDSELSERSEEQNSPGNRNGDGDSDGQYNDDESRLSKSRIRNIPMKIQ